MKRRAWYLDIDWRSWTWGANFGASGVTIHIGPLIIDHLCRRWR